jgi:hypothetical protein
MNQQGKILRIGARLKGGSIFDATAARALYMPPLSIYGTTEGGFNVTSEFTTKDSIFWLADGVRY